MKKFLFLSALAGIGILFYWVSDTMFLDPMNAGNSYQESAYGRFNKVRILGTNEHGTSVVAIGYKSKTFGVVEPDVYSPIPTVTASPVTITYADLFLLNFDSNEAGYLSDAVQLTNEKQIRCLAVLRHSGVDYVTWRSYPKEVSVARITGGTLEHLWQGKSKDATDRGTCPALHAGKNGEVAAVFNFVDSRLEGVLEDVFLVGLRDGVMVDEFDLSADNWSNLGARSAYSSDADAFYVVWGDSNNISIGVVSNGFSSTNTEDYHSATRPGSIPEDVAYLFLDEVKEDVGEATIEEQEDGSLILHIITQP